MVIDSSNYAAKPAVVVVNGSFCPELFYSDMKEEFSKAGYEAVVANIPSIGNGDRLPAATVAEDASHIHSITSKLANQGKDVVLMTHSYGGIPGTESAQGLAKKEREAVGKVGGIVRLIYMTSVVPPVGKSLGDLLGDSLPETIEVQGEYMRHKPDYHISAGTIFSDLPLPEGTKWAQKMSRHSTISFSGKLTYPAYKYIPISWIFCDKDLVLPSEFQQRCIDMISNESGNVVDVHHLPDAGHCPNVSMPDLVAETVRRAIGESF